MAFFEYLKFDGTVLPLPDSYDVSLSAVEADSSGETEAGTTQRDVVRQGIVTISVSFSVTAKWLKALTAYSKQDKLSVDYFDTETADMKNTEMYIEGFKAKLEKDTSYRGLWTVSFTLKEFQEGGVLLRKHSRDIIEGRENFEFYAQNKIEKRIFYIKDVFFYCEHIDNYLCVEYNNIQTNIYVR